ncbi:glucosyltransferase domain-containing protein [Lacibacter sp. H407]|uniref:glucosyltransferase domain-containing protein n=1 Tax=Lacibacter sp. H407 TaxID=3133423 RepID=UPI0030C259B2
MYSKQPALIIGIAVLASLLIYYPVFFADYAFTDEAHQLWNNQDGSNFTMFLNQGRIITGWLIDGAFGNMDSVADIKWLRIFSFATMLVFIVVYGLLSKKLFDALKLDRKLWALSVVFIPCSLSTAIYIGWASCAEIFTGTLAAFLSGYVLFSKVNSSEQYIQIPTLTLIVSLFFALCSLFTYQTTFGFFLLPFFLYFITNKPAKLDRTILIGLGFYLACYVVYYFLFKYSLKVYQVPASDRATINIDPLGKLSFFLSYPLAQAFSFNFLYNARSILSQVFYPLVILLWVLSTVVQIGKKNIGRIVTYIIICFTFFILSYLPLMISIENFASYRTMFALNFLAFVMICETGLAFLKKASLQKGITIFVGVVLFVVAFYNYQFQFTKPLQKEYTALRNHFLDHYTDSTTTVIFYRPPVSLFRSAFGVHYYTDEFGYPSTEKDWTIEPLVRQFVLEKRSDRAKAKQLNVVNLSNAESLSKKPQQPAPNELVIDMESVFHVVAKAGKEK